MIYPPPTRIAAIVALEPDAQCHVFEEPDGTYRVEWLDDSITQPSKSAIDAKYNELVAAEPLNRVREERDRRLAETDYWALADMADMTQAQINYRQALRDITDNCTSLDDVVWPEKPSG